MNKKLLTLLIVIAVLVVGLWLYQQSKPTVAPVVEEPGMVEGFPVEGFPVEQGAAPIVEIPLLP